MQTVIARTKGGNHRRQGSKFVVNKKAKGECKMNVSSMKKGSLQTGIGRACLLICVVLTILSVTAMPSHGADGWASGTTGGQGGTGEERTPRQTGRTSLLRLVGAFHNALHLI